MASDYALYILNFKSTIYHVYVFFQVLSPIATNASGGIPRLLTHRVIHQGRGATLQLATSNAGTAAGTPVSLVAIGQSSVNASSYPTLVNTLSSPSRRTQPTVSQPAVLASPSRSNPSHPLSPSASPQTRKKMRVTSDTPVSEEIMSKRKLIVEHKLSRLKSARSKYADLAAELFFLQVIIIIFIICALYSQNIAYS